MNWGIDKYVITLCQRNNIYSYLFLRYFCPGMITLIIFTQFEKGEREIYLFHGPVPAGILSRLYHLYLWGNLKVIKRMWYSYQMWYKKNYDD